MAEERSRSGKAITRYHHGRLIRTTREEEVDLSEYRDFADAYGQLGRFLGDMFNQKWNHSSQGYLTPAEFEQQRLVAQKATALQ